MSSPIMVTDKTDQRIVFKGIDDVDVFVYFHAIAEPDGIRLYSSDFYNTPRNMPTLGFEQVEELAEWLQQKLAQHRLAAEPAGELVSVIDTIGVQ
jgi:hypothetical protein